MDDDLLELFRSPTERPCRERELVLQAKGVPHRATRTGDAFVLLVPASAYRVATREIEAYEDENRDWPPRFEVPEACPGYVQGTVVYVALLVVVFLFDFEDALGWSWKDLGRSTAASAGGEPWRALTSLTLHSGVPHLVSNLVFGAFFGFLVAYTHGGGVGWLATLAAGALGNLTDSWLRSPEAASVGASTAVFGAVGILVGSEAWRRNLLRERRLRRAMPILMGFLLLAYLGLGGRPDGLSPATEPRVNVLAHLTGLAWGLPLGAALAALPRGLLRSMRVQMAAGTAAVGLLAAAWAVAAAAG